MTKLVVGRPGQEVAPAAPGVALRRFSALAFDEPHLEPTVGAFLRLQVDAGTARSRPLGSRERALEGGLDAGFPDDVLPAGGRFQSAKPRS